MNGVFLDSVGMIAVWDVADQWHTAADPAYQKLLALGRPVAQPSAPAHIAPRKGAKEVASRLHTKLIAADRITELNPAYQLDFLISSFPSHQWS